MSNVIRLPVKRGMIRRAKASAAAAKRVRASEREHARNLKRRRQRRQGRIASYGKTKADFVKIVDAIFLMLDDVAGAKIKPVPEGKLVALAQKEAGVDDLIAEELFLELYNATWRRRADA